MPLRCSITSEDRRGQAIVHFRSSGLAARARTRCCRSAVPEHYAPEAAADDRLSDREFEEKTSGGWE